LKQRIEKKIILQKGTYLLAMAFTLVVFYPNKDRRFSPTWSVKSSVATYHGYNYHPVVISSNKHFSKRK
jgi:hypothetical protein